MGILNKLLGEMRPKHKSNTSQVPEQPVSVPEEKIRTPEETEELILRNPYSSSYRVQVQQTQAGTSTLDYIPFYQKSRGNFVTLDFETTGLSYVDDQIIEIGAVKVENGEITDKYQQLVNPEMPIKAQASSVNHIRDSMLVGQPFIFEVLPDLLHFIGNSIVVAHNAPFDYRFLAQACMRYRFKIPDDWFDSRDLSQVWPEADNRKLSSLLSAAGITNKMAHSALGDAEALALLVIQSFKKEINVKIPGGTDMGYSIEHFKGTVELIDDCLAKKKFVITGEVKGYERYDLEKLIAAHGGKATLKVSGATDYLIVGSFDNMPPGYISAKEEYARKLISEGGKVQIIKPEEFFAMMK